MCFKIEIVNLIFILCVYKVSSIKVQVQTHSVQSLEQLILEWNLAFSHSFFSLFGNILVVDDIVLPSSDAWQFWVANCGSGSCLRSNWSLWTHHHPGCPLLLGLKPPAPCTNGYYRIPVHKYSWDSYMIHKHYSIPNLPRNILEAIQAFSIAPFPASPETCMNQCTDGSHASRWLILVYATLPGKVRGNTKHGHQTCCLTPNQLLARVTRANPFIIDVLLYVEQIMRGR